MELRKTSSAIYIYTVRNWRQEKLHYYLAFKVETFMHSLLRVAVKIWFTNKKSAHIKLQPEHMAKFR